MNWTAEIGIVAERLIERGQEYKRNGGKGFSARAEEIYLAALEAAMSGDAARALSDGGALGIDRVIRETAPTFIYGAYHLCHVACAVDRGDNRQAKKSLAAALSYCPA